MVEVDGATADRAEGGLALLDGEATLRWARLGASSLQEHRGAINTLNVFPVPDSDTGTNMAHTMGAALARAERLVESIGTDAASTSADRITDALAKGAIREARGNSGVILSQVLRAIATHTTAEGVTAATIGLALRTAVSIASEAISAPVEGTIITVLRYAAEAAETAEDSLAAVAVAVADAACEALERTPEQLDALRLAGVVDAGGRGLLILLDALVKVVTGITPQRPDFARRAPFPSEAADDSAHGHAHGHGHGDDPTGSADVEEPLGGPSRFEVMYALHGMGSPEAAMLRGTLRDLGDSVIVATDGGGGDDAFWSVHVHTNSIGEAIEAGIGLGTMADIRVSELAEHAAAAAGGLGGGRAEPGRTVVAMVDPGPISALFEEAGALTIDASASETAVIRALLEVSSLEIVVLANGALDHEQMTLVDAELVSRGRHCILLPTKSVVQGLAALAVHDPGASLSIDGFDMADAASATRFARLDRAPKRALTLVGPCEVGDVVGVIGHDVAVVDPAPGSAFTAVMERLLTVGGEMLTVFASEEIRGTVDTELSRIAEEYPDLEIVTYDAGTGGALAYVGIE